MKKRLIFFKRVFVIGGIFFFLFFIFRGVIYKSLIEYKDIGERKSYSITNNSLAAYIEFRLSDEKKMDIRAIANISQSITSEILSFSLKSNVSDPNILWETRNVNCVGYVAFTATVMNYILERTGDEQVWRARPRKGLLFCGGICLNKYFHNRYFIDHDFVLLHNLESGIEIYIDPSVHDYLGVSEVKKYPDR